jgi:hypothetical protein
MPALGFIEPCLPMISRTVPTGAGWAYEIKHDGFRFDIPLIVQRGAGLDFVQELAGESESVALVVVSL